MFLILERSGAPPRRIRVDGQVALVGRAPNCDVVIDEDFVSKQHLRVLRGLVAIDLSTNGTFIDGERIVGGALLGNQKLQLGQSDITIRVEADPLPQSEPSGPVPPAATRPQGGGPAPGAAQDQNLGALLKKVTALEELRTQLTRELEQANRVAAALRAENEGLQARLAEPRAEPAPSQPADGSAASMLLFKLQRENAQLKRALAEKGVAASPAPSLPTPVAPAAGGVPVAGGSLAGGIVPQARDAVPPVAAGPTVPTRGAPPAKSVPALGLPGGALARLRELVQQDAENTPARPDDPLDAFLIVEAFRFLRRVERVVTRMAGGLIQLYQLRTTVPGVEGNLRELLVAILENINAPAARADLLDYLKGLGHGLVVSLGAYRGAAEKFALQLKADLTAEALIANDPISVVKKVSGKSDAELWRRVTTYLRNLSPDRVNERVEQFARETADDLARKEEA